MGDSINKPLITEYRGEIAENVEFGRIAVVDQSGKLIASVGEVMHTPTYYRSASKPVQALAALRHNLHKRYGLTDSEVAIMAGSHAGEAFHERALESMLLKFGFTEDMLITPPTYPANADSYLAMKLKNLPPRKLLHNCTGKHIALMALQRELTGSVDGYHELDSKADEEVLEVISKTASVSVSKVIRGVDGCGVPVYAVPLYNMALSYLKMVRPRLIDDPDTAAGAVSMEQAMRTNPYMLRGTGYICSEINTDPNILAKGGADGVYCLALKKQGIGVAFKIASGRENRWPQIIMSILRHLGADSPQAVSAIKKISSDIITNVNGDKVGEYVTEFKL